jgi:hypothetical protein
VQPLPLPIEAQLDREPDAPRPLYSIRQISWGSYVGGPIAGTWLLALTLGRLGRGQERRAVYAWGALATLATALVGMVAPTDLPNAVIPAPRRPRDGHTRAAPARA